VSFIAAVPILGNVSKNLGNLPERTPVNIPTALKDVRNIDRSVAVNDEATKIKKVNHMYLVAVGDNGKYGKKFGCNDSLVSYAATDSATVSLKQRIQKLMNTKQQYYRNTKLYNPLHQSDLTVAEIRQTNDGKVLVHLTGDLKLNGACDNPRVYEQLTAMVQEEDSTKIVQIFLNGLPLEKSISEK